MIEIGCFIAGMVVMDALWAWKTGVMKSVWLRFKQH